MLVVFILSIIVSVILSFFLLLMSSTLRVDIKKFHADNYLEKEKKVKDYLIYIRLYLFNKIKWFGFRIDRKRTSKFKVGRLLKLIDKKMGIARGEEVKRLEGWIVRNRKMIVNKGTLRNINKMKIHISKLNLDLDIGTESPVLVAFIVAFLSSAISIMLGKNVRCSDSEKYKYVITPIYLNKNIFKIKVNCIINVKMVHIMNMIYDLLKRRSGNEHGRTSNRRSYDYSHE